MYVLRESTLSHIERFRPAQPWLLLQRTGNIFRLLILLISSISKTHAFVLRALVSVFSVKTRTFPVSLWNYSKTNKNLP